MGDETGTREQAAATGAAAEPGLALSPSRQFPNWLAERRASLAFTTCQAGKLFLIGPRPSGRLSPPSARSTPAWRFAPRAGACG